MITWICENSANLIVGGIVAAVVIFIAVKIIRDKKRGKSSCSCGCMQCSEACGCHEDRKNKKRELFKKER